MDLQSSSLNNKNNQKTLYQNNDTTITATITANTATATTKKHDDDDDVIDEIYYTHKSKLNVRLQKKSLEYRRRIRVLSFCNLSTCLESCYWEPYDAKKDKTGEPSKSEYDKKLFICPLHDKPSEKTSFNPPANHRYVTGCWKYICKNDRDPQLDSERKRHIQFLMESTG